MLVERDRARNGHVERLRALGQRDGRRLVAGGDDVVRQTLALGAEDVRDRDARVEARQRRPAVRDERHALPGRLVETGQRDAEDRAGRGPERFRAGRIGATA